MDPTRAEPRTHAHVCVCGKGIQSKGLDLTAKVNSFCRTRTAANPDHVLAMLKNIMKMCDPNVAMDVFQRLEMDILLGPEHTREFLIMAHREQTKHNLLILFVVFVISILLPYVNSLAANIVMEYLKRIIDIISQFSGLFGLEYVDPLGDLRKIIH